MGSETDYIYGVCRDCSHVYTKPILLPGEDRNKPCPQCGTIREPMPITDEVLPPPPDFIPITVKEFFMMGKQCMLLVLLYHHAYRVGAWVGDVPSKFQPGVVRTLGLGTAGGSMALTPEMVEAAWRIGDRPGHRG